jgi:hypothetical protein
VPLLIIYLTYDKSEACGMAEDENIAHIVPKKHDVKVRLILFWMTHFLLQAVTTILDESRE